MGVVMDLCMSDITCRKGENIQTEVHNKKEARLEWGYHICEMSQFSFLSHVYSLTQSLSLLQSM